MAKRGLPKPTLDYVTDLVREKRDQYQSDRDVLERIRKMRNNAWQVSVPERLKRMVGGSGLEYRDATIADELLTLPTMYTEQNPSLALRADVDTKETQGLTTRLEYFTTAALFEDCGTRSPGPATHERMIDATFEGGAWTQLVKDDDVWCDYRDLSKAGADAYEDDPDDAPAPRRDKYAKYNKATEDAKRKGGVPIRWRSVDALTIFPVFEGDVLVAVCEVQRRSLSTTLRQYGLGMDDDGKICPHTTSAKDWSSRADSNAECEFIAYWDDTWMSYVISYGGGFQTQKAGGTTPSPGYQIPGYTRKHRYNLGRPPYYVGYGATKNYEAARLCTWSAAESKRYEVEYVSYLRTILAYLAVREAMPTLYEMTPADGALAVDGDTGAPLGPTQLELGMIYRGRPGQSMVSAFPPANTDGIQRELQATRQDLGRLSPARKSGELGDLGGEGFALSTVYEKDRARYHQFESSVLRHLSEVTIDFWKLCESLDEDVYVFRNAAEDGGYIKVSPSDFETPVRPTWSLHVDSTAANIIKQRYAEAMQKAGYWSSAQAMEFLGVNADETYTGLATDRVRATPAYQAAEEAEIWAAWGKGKAWESKQQRAQSMAAAPPGGPVPPGQPGAGTPVGGPGMPGDQAALATSPNGAGVTPGTEFQPAGGGAMGMPAGAQVQTAGATAQASF